MYAIANESNFRTLQNEKSICSDDIERKVMRKLWVLKAFVALELDSAWKSRKMHNGIKVDNTFW